jgi:stage II sporulation protein D
VRVTEVTPAGRVATLEVETDRRTLSLRGNEMRSALRLPGGEILYSTYFSVDAITGRDGVESLTLSGGGNGHGVGMCQAGAIGRARAGQDFRTILRTYYPGTTVGTIE